MADTARIAELEERERETWRLYSAVAEVARRLSAEHDEAEILLAEAKGDMDRARWLRLNATPGADPAEKQAAYVRLQAKNALAGGDPQVILSVLPEPDRTAVAAEVERIRAEAPVEPESASVEVHGAKPSAIRSAS